MDSATPGLVVMGSIEEAAPLHGHCTSSCLQVHALTPMLLRGYGTVCYGFDVLSLLLLLTVTDCDVEAEAEYTLSSPGL